MGASGKAAEKRVRGGVKLALRTLYGPRMLQLQTSVPRHQPLRSDVCSTSVEIAYASENDITMLSAADNLKCLVSVSL